MSAHTLLAEDFGSSVMGASTQINCRATGQTALKNFTRTRGKLLHTCASLLTTLSVLFITSRGLPVQHSVPINPLLVHDPQCYSNTVLQCVTHSGASIEDDCIARHPDLSQQ